MKTLFLSILLHVRSRRKETSSEIHTHGIYWGVKLFLQPIKLLEISITMSWNYITNSIENFTADDKMKLL